MKKSVLFAVVVLGISCSVLFAVSLQDWIKKGGGYQKTRKVTAKQTMVAAVRGVEELEDVDSQARNFDGVAKMESFSVPKDKLIKFISEEWLNKK